MADMYAYLDDYGTITIWVSRNFYDGRSKRFCITTGKDYCRELTIRGVEDHERDVRYNLIAPADMEFGQDYRVFEEHGLSVPLIVRLIVRTERFNKDYYYDGDDLGAVYHRMYTDFALWAPTAVSVLVRVRVGDKITVHVMKRTEKGVWRAQVRGDLRHATYVYYVTRNGETVIAQDPYALSSTGNGKESAVINLEEVMSIRDPMPSTPFRRPTDAIIYECNVRDMTSHVHTGTHDVGTFAALCEENTSWHSLPTGMSYLASLGMTHVQLQPVSDYATVDEFRPRQSYNWGYDPLHYLCLEGSYSSDPDDPYARMKEFRTLVAAFHAHNIRVNVDVVFNHMYNIEMCSYDQTVPYYYFRYSRSGFLSNGSYCGNDGDSCQPMTRRHLLHVMEMWIKLYGLDGFRFDLMGILDTDTMNALAEKARSLKPGVMIYGEGWDMPTELDASRKASIANQAKMPGIGHFNDFSRDVLKGRTGDNDRYDRGYLTGDTGQAFSALSALAATVLDAPYTFRFDDPGKSINAWETHDNLTVWDKMHYCCGNENRETRQRRQKMLIAATMVAQGVPFLHAGQEFCGTKNDNGNSYRAGDNINAMNWDRAAINRHIVEYTRKAILLRKRYAGFRLSTREEIEQCLKLSVQDNGIVFYDIHYPDPATGTNVIRVIINPTNETRSFVFGEEWRTVFDENGNSIGAANSYIQVSALSLSVLVR